MSFVDCGANQGIYEKADVMVIAGVGVPRDCFFQKNYAPTNAGPRVSNTKVIMDIAKTYPGRSSAFVCIAPNIPNVGEWSCDGAVELDQEARRRRQDYHLRSGLAGRDLDRPGGDGLQAGRHLGRHTEGHGGADLRRSRGAGTCGQGPLGGPASLYNPDFPPAIGKAWDGKVWPSTWSLNSAEANTPDMKNWRAVMDQYVEARFPRDTFAQAGYLAARVVTETLLKMDPAKIDRASVTAALRGVKKFDSDMFCAPCTLATDRGTIANHNGPTWRW